MRIIGPKVEYWSQEASMEGLYNQIARATRTCYQSSVREGESSEDFVKRIILKPALIDGNLDDLTTCWFNFDKMHGAMLEHGTVYITERHILPDYDSVLRNLPYTKIVKGYPTKIEECKDRYYITTNLRVILEYGVKEIINEAHLKGLGSFEWFTEPTEHHVKRYTFSVITDIGVTREFNRHRTFSIAEESTRYCNFNRDKFGSELTFITPNWNVKDKPHAFEQYENACKNAEYYYKELITLGWRPEQARQVLPLGLKTQAIYTAFSSDWEHFLRLRADNVSGKVHPNMEIIAKQIKEIGMKEGLWK